VASVEDRAIESLPARQFDFWLGDWDLRWEPDGRGVNMITSILDDHAVLEQFDGRPSIPLAGMSVSVFDRDLGRWRQVWVDTDGQYLDFIGGLDGDRMVFERRRSDGRLQRMVWSNIAAASLLWSWEHSDDDGANWTVDWAIDYRRRTLVPASEL
jgi:hypothetical protein